MKRMIAVFMVLGLMFGAVTTAEAAKKKKKKAPTRVEETVEVAYNGPNVGAATPVLTGGACFPGQDVFGCLQAIPTIEGAAFVQIEVLDASGQKAGGFISQGEDADGNGAADGYGQFCGAHPEPIPLTVPGAPVDISLYMGVCSDASGPSIVTSGTINVTFSNMP